MQQRDRSVSSSSSRSDRRTHAIARDEDRKQSFTRARAIARARARTRAPMICSLIIVSVPGSTHARCNHCPRARAIAIAIAIAPKTLSRSFGRITRRARASARTSLGRAQRCAHVNGFLQIKELIGLHIRSSAGPPERLCKADISRINMGASVCDVSLHFHSGVAIVGDGFFFSIC